MMLLLSGEGPTDIGVCRDGGAPCDADRFQPGPMAVIVDQLAEREVGYSLMDNFVHFVGENEVTRRSKRLSIPRSPRLSGSKNAKDTAYFHKNAMALGRIARDLETKRELPVVAVLFRDADGSNTSTRGSWRKKFDSMEKGFRDAEYGRGVPMVPNPKSEAWLLCALKEQAYQACESLEHESGNDASPNSLKDRLARIMGHQPNADELADWVRIGRIDPERIDMPSFTAFRHSLERAISRALASDKKNHP